MDAPRPRSPSSDAVACEDSPRCILSGGFAARFELAPGGVVFAVHVGPMHDGRSDVAAHPLVLTSNGGWQARGPVTRARRETPPEQRATPDLRVDYVVRRESRELDVASMVWRLDTIGDVWVLEARASKREDGPYALWRAPADGLKPTLMANYVDGYWTAAAEDEVRRCLGLLDRMPKARRSGRPSLRGKDDVWRSIALQAEQMRAAHPTWSYDAIALKLDVHPRTLRMYRRRLEAETVAPQGDLLAPRARIVTLREVS